MYEIIFDGKAIECLEKLPQNISKRIFNKILNSKTNPQKYFKKLKGRNEFSLRVGNYRIIVDIFNKKLVILVLYIEHRKKVYGWKKKLILFSN